MPTVGGQWLDERWVPAEFISDLLTTRADSLHSKHSLLFVDVGSGSGEHVSVTSYLHSALGVGGSASSPVPMRRVRSGGIVPSAKCTKWLWAKLAARPTFTSPPIPSTALFRRWMIGAMVIASGVSPGPVT